MKWKVMSASEKTKEIEMMLTRIGMPQKSVLRRGAITFSFLCVLLCCGSPAVAQRSTGSTAMLYGKVVDEAGNPIMGANVNVTVDSEHRAKALSLDKADLVTDAAGMFRVDRAGTSIAVKSIKKAGYTIVPTQFGPRPLSGAVLSQTDVAGSSPEKPVVFVLRKKGEPAFLVRTSYKLLLKQHAKRRYSFDIDRPAGKDKLGFTVGTDNKRPQLVIETDSNKQDAYYLSFIMNQEEGGLVLSGLTNYVAPREGYKRKVTIEFNAAGSEQPIRKRVFVRTIREDVVQYSRLELDFLPGKAGLIVNISSWTNPDGSPNLEYDEMFQRRELARRIRQAQEEDVGHEFLGSNDGQVRPWDFTGNRRRASQKERTERRTLEGTVGAMRRQTQEQER